MLLMPFATFLTGSQYNAYGEDVKMLNLTANFTSFNFHVGQNFYIRLFNINTGMEVPNSRREMKITQQDFTVKFDSIPLAKEYWGMGFSFNVDFWVDVNNDDMYEPPPADHAWRVMIQNMKNDTSFSFMHNTNFVDVKWPAPPTAKLYVNFTDMSPHIGQTFHFRVWHQMSGEEHGRKSMVITGASFTVGFDDVEMGEAYNIDFYADLNKNDKYDPPPADHAWRIQIGNLMADSTVSFSHNTKFSDIKWPDSTLAGVENDIVSFPFLLRQNYPNPFNNSSLISFSLQDNQNVKIELFDESGQLVKNIMEGNLSQGDYQFEVNSFGLMPGIYYYRLNTGSSQETKKMIIIK